MAESPKWIISPQGEKNGGKPRDTTATSIFSARGAGADEDLSAFPKTPDRLLDALRQRLSRCRVMVNDSGILCEQNEDGTFLMYKNLPNNLRGAWMLKIGDLQFMTGRTRSTWVLLYDQLPETVSNDRRFIGAVYLMNRDILVLDSGKTMFLSRVERGEIDSLNAIAASSAEKSAKSAQPMPAKEAKTAPAAPEPEFRLAPSLSGAISYEGIKKALKASATPKEGEEHTYFSSDPFFDLKRFAESIKFITTEQDNDGIDRYYIIAGDEEKEYWLYVNANPSSPSGSASFTSFKSNNDSCILYKVGDE